MRWTASVVRTLLALVALAWLGLLATLGLLVVLTLAGRED